MRKTITVAAVVAALAGCQIPVMTPPTPPSWAPVLAASEAEYEHFRAQGTATLTGQAFLTQVNGGVVRAAGREVTLDPATTVGVEWWTKAGKLWVQRDQTPPSPGFAAARRKTIADADGRFKFADLPAGRYYVRTQVTWSLGEYSVQGGLVGQQVELTAGRVTDVILSKYPD